MKTITIRDVDNGAILTIHDSLEDDEGQTKTFAYTYDLESHNEIDFENFETMMGHVCSELKYGRPFKRIDFELRRCHGDEYDCQAKDCEICGTGKYAVK